MDLVRLALVMCLLAVASPASAEEKTLGLCYAASDNVECHADVDPQGVVDYVRKQCNFWSNAQGKCREVYRCTRPGYFVVAFKDEGGKIRALCGVPNRSSKQARAQVEAACGSDCTVDSWWLGPPPKDDDREDERREEQRRLEEQRRIEDERRREEQRRLEEQRKRDEEKRREEQRKREEQLAAEKKQREEAQKRAWAEQKQREEALKKKHAQQRSGGGGSRTTGGTGVVDERTRRQQRIAQGFDDLRRTQETNRRLGNNLAGAAGAVFMQGGGETPSPFSTRRIQLEFGIGGRFWPVMTDTSGSVRMHSGRDASGGFSLELGVQYWPIYRPRYGAGLVLHGAAAGIAVPGGGMYGAEAGAGIHTYLGRRTGTTLRAEADVTARVVGHSSNLIGAVSTGSGSYRVLRLGLGVRRCLSKERKAKEHCASYVGGSVLRDSTTISDTDPALVFRAELAGRMRLGVIGVTVEMSTSYPAPGDTSYSLEEGRHGFHIAFLLRKAWTWY